MSTLVALTVAAKSGSSQTIRKLLRTHAIDVNRPVALCTDPIGLSHEHGLTPLHRAAWHNHAEAVAVLLEHGAQHGIRTSNGRTAEDLAGTRNEAVKRVLREHRERLQRPVCTPEAGRMQVLATRLATAAETKLLDLTVEHLAAGASSTIPTITETEDAPRMHAEPVFELPAIHRAAYFFDRNVMDAMLKYEGPHVLRAEDGKGCTPLHWLAAAYAHCTWGRPKLLQGFAYMINAGADVNARNDAGKTPYDLMHLDEPDDLCDVRTACIMADLGADANLTETLAHTAREWSNARVATAAKLLVKHGADPEVLQAYRLVSEPRRIGSRTICKVIRVALLFAKEENVRFHVFKGGSQYISRAQMLRSSLPPPSLQNTKHCDLVARLKVMELWSTATHSTFSTPTKSSIETVLRCAQRLSNEDRGFHLPPELWLIILGFRSAVRWPIEQKNNAVK